MRSYEFSSSRLRAGLVVYNSSRCHRIKLLRIRVNDHVTTLRDSPSSSRFTRNSDNLSSAPLFGRAGLLHADHVTVWRWVQRYAPEMELRLRRRLKPTSDSWRVDETYIRVKGKWVYLYRAVDSTGATIDFLLSAKRDAAAAERFLAKALSGANHPAPRVGNTDKHAGLIWRTPRAEADSRK